VQLRWEPDTGIEGARLVPVGAAGADQVPVSQVATTVLPGTYVLEVLVNATWQALGGSLVLREREVLEVTLGLDEEGLRVERLQSR
jgi:hypothetical protein